MTRISTIVCTGQGVMYAAALTLAGCTLPPPSEKEPEAKGAEPAAPSGRSSSRRSERYLKALPDRPLNASAQCRFTDPDGYQARLELGVKDARVQRFQADVFIPGRGNCHFNLKDFRQTGTKPVTLRNAKGDCEVHMWEQGTQVTVAFGKCQAQCSGNARDYLWPILVNSGNGSCS